MFEKYDAQRAKEIDSAIAEVAMLCPETLVQRGIALPASRYNRLRFHPEWRETGGVMVIVKLAASDDREETQQTELYRCVVSGTRPQPATMRA